MEKRPYFNDHYALRHSCRVFFSEEPGGSTTQRARPIQQATARRPSWINDLRGECLKSGVNIGSPGEGVCRSLSGAVLRECQLGTRSNGRLNGPRGAQPFGHFAQIWRFFAFQRARQVTCRPRARISAQAVLGQVQNKRGLVVPDRAKSFEHTAKMAMMNINGISTRTIWPVSQQRAVDIIDQTALPHEFRTLRLSTLDEAAHAIRSMQVRGAPLIGATAAYGVALALAQCADDAALAGAVNTLAATRPTAVNLHWALIRMQALLMPLPVSARADAAWREAGALADEDAAQCRRIGEQGLALLRPLAEPRGRLEVMTHCNAGWLATVDYGTALAPVYAAFDAGIEVHVWVSETRPRNQGLLTAWELQQHGVPHTVFADNAAGLLLARNGRFAIDAVIVGADRIAANGDVANKIGTYLKALAAYEAEVPFYVAAPRSTVDFNCPSGKAIPIEERSGEELRLCSGTDHSGHRGQVRQLLVETAIVNPAFDVTPAKFISALMTERGSCAASSDGLLTLYPEMRNVQTT